MRSNQSARIMLLAAVMSFSLMAGALVAFAQAPGQSMLTDPRMVVIPSRQQAEISGDINNVEQTKQLALDRKVQAENRLREVEAAIDTRKAALQDVNRRKDDAKKAKRESEIIALQIEVKANQQALELLNKLKDLRKTDIETAQVAADQADLEMKSLQMEGELLRKRTEYDSLSIAGADNLTLTTAQQVLRELEVRLLKLQQEQASATQKLASKQKDVVTRRTKLHEAQLKLGMPRA